MVRNDKKETHFQIEKVLPNLRDLSISGGLQHAIPRGVLYRSARNFATSLFLVKKVLCDILQIKTIIDLRDDNLSSMPREKLSREIVSQLYHRCSPMSIQMEHQILDSKDSSVVHDRGNEPEIQAFRQPVSSQSTPCLSSCSSLISKHDSESMDEYKNVTLSRHEKKCQLYFTSNSVHSKTAKSKKAVACHWKKKSFKDVQRKLYVVNILDTPEIRSKVMDTLSKSYRLPLFAMYKMVDKLTGSGLASYYFCKYFVSSHNILESYKEMCICCGQKFAKALKLITLAKFPILIHCSLGKDRTGILSMLLLSILGASDESIIHDYVLTECTDSDFTHYKHTFVVDESGLAEEFIYAHPITYFIGFTQEWRHVLVERLSLFKNRHIKSSTCSHFSS
ncbi:uncharacterized protein LOC128882883 isoform X2 [Hylaeus volcanicus]|uniref:uncharacterized protein LOC128882883 isoform X2 n=1 Tax=Hylaeus volcanicus TaxID=313075 RepID=UPI0023B82C91|nr:uncharacterized protein LOC128882883 isoform X2 [Hylaeus volcanicus]